MVIRIGLCFAAALSFTGCAALSSQISEEMAPQISTEVAIQVGTAVVEQVATVVAERLPPATAVADDGSNQIKEEIGIVTRVIDGDTIDVLIDGKTARIRYVQTNTPERDEPCFRESTKANADLVANKTVRLLPSKNLTDPFGRLLRFVYVGDIMVERVLVEGGWAEVVLYPPNDAHYDEFVQLEAEAAAAAPRLPSRPASSTMAQPPADEEGDRGETAIYCETI